MSDNKLVPQNKSGAAVALEKTTNLLSITNKILANRTNKMDDAWLDELIVWANENQIPEEQLPRDKQAILALTRLHLRLNQVTKLPDSRLDLMNNNLTELPEFIGKLTNLTELILFSNQLTQLPDSIGKLTNLTRLILFNNRLTKLPDSIGKLTNLTDLNLSHNPIKSLPSELSHLRHITKFD